EALAGKLAAEFLFVRMGGAGHAAELVSQNGSESGVVEGFREISKETTTISVMTENDAGPTIAQAAHTAAALFDSDPKLNGVFAGTDEIALGVLKAARHGGILKRMAIVGLGGAPATLRAVQKGDLDGVVVADAEELGRLALRSATAAADGGRVPPKETVDVQLVTKENVKAFLP
ncbi:MAG TPA: substrate-binding domain-containing protein, partial [Actinomycetota bacterium]